MNKLITAIIRIFRTLAFYYSCINLWIQQSLSPTEKMSSNRAYWIDGTKTGRLGISIRPEGHEWLKSDIEQLRRMRVDVLISLLEEVEAAELGLSDEAEVCADNGIEFIQHPIPDRSVPIHHEHTLELVQEIVRLLEAGKSVLIHCRKSIGRSPMIAASALVMMGDTPRRAFMRIKRVRKKPVPDTAEQAKWVRDVVESYVEGLESQPTTKLSPLKAGWLPWSNM